MGKIPRYNALGSTPVSRLPRFLFTAGLVAASIGAVAQRSRPPSVVLWAWERRTDLSFIETKKTGVAYLDATVTLGTGVSVQPRRQPLRVPPETYLIAVIRIEARVTDISPELVPEVVAALLKSADRSDVKALQIDFDALQSQRLFYQQLLEDLHRQLPPAKGLSITALASWCAGDNWLTSLPIDEAVPMLFRMGPDRALFEREGLGLIRETRCAGSVGLSTDEPWPRDLTHRTLYLFNPSGWTRESVAAALARARS